MRNVLVPLALVATAMAQGVTQIIAPPGAAPAECVPNMNGKYELTVDAIEPGLAKRQEPVTNTLLVTLENGVLKDRYNRIGYIASNRQFQFDGPPQAGALYTGGWTLCSNGVLALGPSQTFYRCLSGDFYNLYDNTLGAQCSKIHLVASQARAEVVNEVPPPGAAPAPAPVPAPAPAPTSPAVVVPPATTTITDGASGLSSVASDLSSAASSLSSSASSVSASISASGVLPPGVTAAPPVDPAAQSAGSIVHVGTAAASSMAALVVLVAFLMI